MAYIYIKSSSISNFFWRESSKYYGYEILTPSFCFQIPPGEGVKNIMAALHWTPSFSNSQREAQNSMAVNYWDLQIFQIPSGGEGGGLKYYGYDILNLSLIFIAIGEGVQKHYGCDILKSPYFVQLLIEKGFRILWRRYLVSPLISNFHWKGGSIYHDRGELTPPPLIFITIKEWIQNFMAAICPPVLFYNFI